MYLFSLKIKNNVMYIFGKYSKKNRFARNFHFFYSLNKKISSSGDFIPYFSRAYFSRASTSIVKVLIFVSFSLIIFSYSVFSRRSREFSDISLHILTKLLSSKNNIQIKNSNTTDIIPYLLNMKYLA